MYRDLRNKIKKRKCLLWRYTVSLIILILNKRSLPYDQVPLEWNMVKRECGIFGTSLWFFRIQSLYISVTPLIEFMPSFSFWSIITCQTPNNLANFYLEALPSLFYLIPFREFDNQAMHTRKVNRWWKSWWWQDRLLGRVHVSLAVSHWKCFKKKRKREKEKFK